MKALNSILLTAILLLTASKVEAHSGTVNWNGWTFNWAVSNAALSEGMVIRNLNYNGQKIMHKGSIPVIRVRYFCNNCGGGNKDNQCIQCGPYADKIGIDKLANIDWSYCTGQRTCSRTYTDNRGVQWLEIGMYAIYGNYKLYYVWYFSSTGFFRPCVFSRGLQHNAAHDHHVYFRLDFDIKGAGDDQVFVYDNNRGNIGWGNGWSKYMNEVHDTKNPATKRFWYITDKLPRNGSYAVQVLPSDHDGVADAWCTKDIGLRRYYYAEDIGWAFWATTNLPYFDNQNIADSDVVFWYVGHLHHEAHDGADEWHNTGPWLYVKS